MKLEIPTVISMVKRSLPLQQWGFDLSMKDSLNIIYNSQYCRIRFLIERDITHDSLRVCYGRLHALDTEWIMTCNGMPHYCWHDYDDTQVALEFLSGVSPQAAYGRRLKPIPLFDEYYKSEFAKSVSTVEEKLLGLHATIWNRYQVRFFELFDLRRTDIWEQYIVFLSEYYRLDTEEKESVFRQKGIPWQPFDPPRYRKC